MHVKETQSQHTCKVVKPFADPNTQNKVKFAYVKDGESQKSMESLFDLEKLESAFGRRTACMFDNEEANF
ncbi:hypothetical protein GOP47_0018084 [Adiantum capillus-veneris]|uniref:Uncharacterized protein n=1 Tax=Adiantum capillus-veneris TaxID=13818 RepID=A0A9D4ZCF7_ADICA|nr:hypothetical protein GOP47_0018084 [Adiantum capillus-veneris]